MKKRVVILSDQDGDWEAMYVDGNCIDQGHELGGGNGTKGRFLLKAAKQYKFTDEDITEQEVNDEDDEMVMDNGSFPETLKELSGNYDTVNEIDDNYE